MVFASTDVAELVFASACHMVASLVLDNIELALRTTFGAGTSCPLHELVILGQIVVVDVVDLLLQLDALLLLLDLLAALLDMVGHFTSEAVLLAAIGAEVVRLGFVVLEEEIVAVFGRALNHVRILVADLFPFELLTPGHLLLSQ